MASTESTQQSPDDYHDDDTYHGTRGFSGSSTSEDAAYADLVKGVTNITQRLVLILAAQAGPKGITVRDVRDDKTSLHHGRISSALTKHHIAGRLVALYERRDHCGVYVLPEYVNERPSRPYHRQGRKPIDPEVIRGVLLDHRSTTLGHSCACGWGAGPGDLSHPLHQAEKIAEALNA